MGFRYKGNVVNLENYKAIFNKNIYSVDVLDEIRSAVLDDTEIGSFIDSCIKDSYKLGQLRMAIRELIPIDLLSTAMTGKTIKLIRTGVSEGVDFSCVRKYIENNTRLAISSEVFESLCAFVYIGTDITRVDFTTIRDSQANVVLRGLQKGCPMWLCCSDKSYMSYASEEDILALIKAMAYDIDVAPLISGKWNPEQINSLLASCVDGEVINRALSILNANFNEMSIRIISLLLKDGYDEEAKKLCAKDKDNYPLYTEYQLSALSEAARKGRLTDDILNPYLSDVEMSRIAERHHG